MQYTLYLTLFEMEEARWFRRWSHQHLCLVFMRNVDL